MYEYDNNFVYMPLEAAQILFQLKDRATTIDLFIENPENLAAARPEIEPALQGRGRLWDWQQAQSSFFPALEVERNVLFLILTLLLLVTALPRISALATTLKENVRDGKNDT